MITQNDINKSASLLQPGQDYIINCDLDGLICGLLIENYTDGRIVGFSRCNGRDDDSLWYDSNCIQANSIASFNDIVFVDLPVVVPGMRMIDQHFISLNDADHNWLSNDLNKVNPNAIEGYTLSNHRYTSKFPFGSCHFIIALLERLGVNVELNQNMPTQYNNLAFRPSDVVYRADRCVGNANRYTSNCQNWSDWLKAFGCGTTAFLFNNLFADPTLSVNERNVEDYLQNNLGTSSRDGDYTNMIMTQNWGCFDAYQRTIADIIGLNPMNISYSTICDFPLQGIRFNTADPQVRNLPYNAPADRVFSRAITNMSTVSVTLY